MPRQVKKWHFLFRIILFLGFIFIAYQIKVYYPRILFYFSGNSVLRLDKQSKRVEGYLIKQKERPKDILEVIEQSRETAKNFVNRESVNPLPYYYIGLFDFYELLLRLPINQHSLLELTGRGFLPQASSFKTIKSRKILLLLKENIKVIHKSLAITDNFLYTKEANLILVFSSFLYTARTDKRELERLENILEADFSPLFSGVRTWLYLSFITQLGATKELRKWYASYQKTQEKQEKETFWRLSPIGAELLLAYGLYHAKDYIRALRHVRNIIHLPNTPQFLQVEALLTQAEIFYRQRGARYARPYFKKAFQASQEADLFIKERIEEIY